MGRYDSHKNAFQYAMNLWANRKNNFSHEQTMKGAPCHVVEVAKDFIKVAFEMSNGIQSLPVVKIPQAFSQFSREPTQVGNKGHAVPSNYYLGGATGDSGGRTSFYPQGNLTAISYNGISHTQNPDRDYDQLTHMAGPNGWVAGNYQDQKQDQQQGGQSGQGGQGVSQSAFFRAQQAQRKSQIRTGKPAVFPPVRRQTDYFRQQQLRINPQRYAVNPLNGAGGQVTSGGGSNGQQSQKGQNQGKTNFNFDKDGICTIQSKDTDHVITCNGKDGKITLKVPTNKKVYVGGDGQEGKYAKLMTESGPVINAMGRIG